MHASKNPQNLVVIEESALQTFLFRLTKKCLGHSSHEPHHKKVQLVEEEAVLFCHLLIQEGLFDINDSHGCAVCAVGNLQKRIMRQTKQQMEVVKKARNYYSQPEHAKFYKLCTKHCPEIPTWSNSQYTNHGQPQSQAQSQPEPQPQFAIPPQSQPRPQRVYYTEPYRYIVPYSFRPPPPPIFYLQEPAIAYMPVMHSFVGPSVTYDNFIPIPYGIDPVYFMGNYYEWVKYFQQPIVASHYKRMPYTKSFPLEPIEGMKINEKR